MHIQQKMAMNTTTIQVENNDLSEKLKETLNALKKILQLEKL